MKALPIEEHRVALRDGGELRYTSSGNANGLPVLLLNGLGAPHRVWNRLIGHAGDRYRFLSWNYRGLSGADTGPRGVNEHAADALAILDAEKVSRAALVGWSMGVQVALEVFHRAPQAVASLVLISGAARAALASSSGVVQRTIGRGLALLQRSPRLTMLALRNGLQSPEAFTWARRVGLIGDRVDADSFSVLAHDFLQMDVGAYLETLRRWAEHDVSDVLRHVDVPMLVITGDRDPFTSHAAVENLVNAVSGAEYLPLDGAGHYVLLDHAERVNLRIEKFWNERGYRVDTRMSVGPTPP